MYNVRTQININDFDKPESKKIFKELAFYLGKKVLVSFDGLDKEAAPRDWDGEPFVTHIVGINKINCGNRGWGGNNAEFEAYPSYTRDNWCNIDLRMIKEILDD